MKNRYDYAYAVARVRALEVRIIAQEIFRQAIEAESLTEALNIISEFTHEEAIKRIKNSEDLELFLKQQSSNLEQEITQLLDNPELLKALFSLQEDLEIAKLKINETKLDFLIKTYGHLTNLQRLTSYLRQNLTDRITSIYSSDYGSIARQAFQSRQKDNSYLLLERLKADFLLNFLSFARYITFGPEPIISYYFTQLNQMRLLRWVILGKINQVPSVRLLALI